MEERLKNLKKEIEKLAQEKIRTETQLENTQKQIIELEHKMSEAGVTPETISQEIETLENDLKQKLAEYEKEVEAIKKLLQP